MQLYVALVERPYGDRFLNRGMAVLAIDGPGQYEAPMVGVYFSVDNWAALGKPLGSDERHGKVTYVTRYGLQGARQMAAESHDNARAALRRAVPSGAPELEQITDLESVVRLVQSKLGK